MSTSEEEQPRESRTSRGIPGRKYHGATPIVNLRFEDDGRTERMLATPLVVVLYGLEDPFQGSDDGGDEREDDETKDGDGGAECEGGEEDVPQEERFDSDDVGYHPYRHDDDDDGDGDGEDDMITSEDNEETENDDEGEDDIGKESSKGTSVEAKGVDTDDVVGYRCTNHDDSSGERNDSKDDEDESENGIGEQPSKGNMSVEAECVDTGGVGYDHYNYDNASETSDDDGSDDESSGQWICNDPNGANAQDEYDPLKEYDSADSDDEDNVVSAGLTSMGLAAKLMKDVVRLDRYRYRRVTVNLSCVPDHASDDSVLRDYRARYAASFANFTTVLEQYRGVRHLELYRGNFWVDNIGDVGAGSDINHDDESGGTGLDLALKAEGPDLERLFGTTTHWRLFTESIPAYWGMKRLTVDNTPLNLECCLLLKIMLQRDVMLDELVLEGCEMDADGFRVVCDGAATNQHLGRLVLSGRAVLEPDTLLAAVGPTSCLSRLEVTVFALATGTLEALLFALRTNTELQELTLYAGEGFYDDGHVWVEELLRTYNWSLQDVSTGPWDPYPSPKVHRLLKRNARARLTYHRMYDVPCRALWPRVFAEMSAFPSLLYRFVRKDKFNAEAFVDQVQAAQQLNNGTRKRPHRQVQ